MSAKLTGSSASKPGESLALWHKQYMAVDGDLISSEHAVIQDLESDELDYDRIEREVQELIPSADVLDGFCGKCRWLLGHWPDISVEVIGDQSDDACAFGRAVHTREVEAAAKTGCKFCLYLLSRLARTSQLDTIRKIEMRFKLLGDDRTSTISIQNWGKTDSQLLWLNLPGKTATGSHFDGARMSGCHTWSERMSSTSRLWEERVEPFEMAKMWLDSCCKEHEACCIKQQRLPTRLVCVNNNTLRLVISSTLPSAPRYATLSYCWGHDPFIKLSRYNLASFLDGIPWDTLPLTFQDAVQATRQLGLQYIWIDALCIIQDTQDWAAEAGQMASVYGGAFISLAASDAQNVYQGFLRRPRLYTNGGFYSRVTSSALCQIRTFYSPQCYDENITEAHLSSRAWAFQERLLPARTIHFGESGLWWECRSRLSSEYLPDDLTELLAPPFKRPAHEPWPWSSIVWHYSKADLTHGSDRLAALSGIAARQHEITGGQYLAGLWSERLVYQLTWAQSTSRKPRPKWRAPTWSWASVDGTAMLYPYRGWDQDEDRLYVVQNDYVQVLKTKTTPSGRDPFGPVDNGELTLSCSYLVRGHLDRAASLEGQEEAVSLDSGLGLYPVEIDCLEDALFDGEGVVYLLPVYRLKFVGIAESAICGLVVEASVTLKGQFRRVGSFHFESDSEEFSQVPSQAEDAGENHYGKLTEVLEKLDEAMAVAKCAQTLPNFEGGAEREDDLGKGELGGGETSRRCIITLI